MSVTKTEMLLLKGSLDRARPPEVKIYGSYVSLKTAVRCLGVYIVARLGITSHVEYLSVKTVLTFYTFARIAQASWGLVHRAMRIRYASLYVPIVAYAAAGWADRIGSHARTKFARSQRQVLLAVTKVYRKVSTDALPVICVTGRSGYCGTCVRLQCP